MTTAPPSAAARRLRPRSIQSAASSTLHNTLISSPQPKPVTLPKRLLFPSLPPDADLPPLLLSPAASPELNQELYDFIALALRAYVNPWWSKITRYDKDFLPEISRILTLVLRNLESRLLATDLAPLLFRDIPTLLTQHWSDYRNAHAKLHTSYASGGAASLPQLFHHIQPHMALSPDGLIDIVYLRQAVDHVLKSSLPPEDYQPETERYIIREVVLKVLAASVLPRLTQPWFIHKIILDLLGPEIPVDAAEALAILVLSAVQSVSGACLAALHAYRQARETIRRVNQSKPAPPLATTPDEGAHGRHATVALDNVPADGAPPTPALPGALSVPLKTEFTPAAVEVPPDLPAPALSSSPSSESVPSFVSPASHLSSTSPLAGLTPSPSPSPSRSASVGPAESAPAPPPQIPNYTYPLLTFLLTLLTPPPVPAPPSSSSSSSSSQAASAPASHPAPAHHASHATARALAYLLTLLASLAAPFLARLLPYLLYAHVLSAPALARTVRAARRALFPDGWPAPAPEDPTPEEQAEMRARVRRRVREAVPGPLQVLLGPTPAARAATVDAALAPLDSQACNAHLAVFMLDLVLLTVFPEMGVSEEG